MKKEKSNDWWEWIKAILITVAIAVIVKQFILAPIVVDGPSMQPTLHNRDHMIVNKFMYRFKDPERFDVVVFHASDKKDFIKRVIGLPGEHIKYKNDKLYVNDKKIDEDFLQDEKNNLTDGEVLTSDFELENLPEGYSTIPEGYFLVLGDNRTNSTDSRMLGLISKKQIVGRTSFIYWPMDRIQKLRK